MAKIKIGVGVVLIGITALTVSFILKNVRKLANLTFDIRTVKLNTLNLQEISLTIFWVIKNPSDFRFIVKNQVYDVFINNKFVRKVGSSEETEVYGRGTSIVKTNVYITTTELLKFTTENLSSLVTEEGRKKTKIKVI
jgi:LEA14-like dessication related protein